MSTLGFFQFLSVSFSFLKSQDAMNFDQCGLSSACRWLTATGTWWARHCRSSYPRYNMVLRE